jgi:hypothetical protein
MRCCTPLGCYRNRRRRRQGPPAALGGPQQQEKTRRIQMYSHMARAQPHACNAHAPTATPCGSSADAEGPEAIIKTGSQVQLPR